jgi:hypothetical protein
MWVQSRLVEGRAVVLTCNDAGKTRDPNSVWSHVRGIWECVGEP